MENVETIGAICGFHQFFDLVMGGFFIRAISTHSSSIRMEFHFAADFIAGSWIFDFMAAKINGP